MIDFSLDACYSQEKLETMVMQNLGVNKVHDGLCENAQFPFRTFTTKTLFFYFFIFPSLC